MFPGVQVTSPHFTMLISPEQEALISRVFEAYLTEHHHGDILQLIADTNEETHHPVVVNAMTLFEANMEVMSTQFKTQFPELKKNRSKLVDLRF